MTSPTVVVLAGVLIALLLVIVAALVWQEGRRHRFETDPIYVIDDAVAHIVATLDPGVLARVSRTGVEQVIEWEVRYLQGGPGTEEGRAPVAGGHWEAVTFIADQLADRGVAFAHEDIAAILAREADYLVSIGAVGRVAAGGGAES